jgi:hypothetical protein
VAEAGQLTAFQLDFLSFAVPVLEEEKREDEDIRLGGVADPSPGLEPLQAPIEKYWAFALACSAAAQMPPPPAG